jgi:hypothetical protein
MAKEYKAKGDALAKEAGADPSPAAERTTLPDIGPDDASLPWPSNIPDPAGDC